MQEADPKPNLKHQAILEANVDIRVVNRRRNWSLTLKVGIAVLVVVVLECVVAKPYKDEQLIDYYGKNEKEDIRHRVLANAPILFRLLIDPAASPLALVEATDHAKGGTAMGREVLHI